MSNDTSSWPSFPLGDVCRTTSGGTPSRKRADYFQGDIPWVKSGELTDGLVFEVSEFITEEAVANSSAKLFPLGTLLIAMYGATVGKLGILAKPAATNQAVCAIFPPPELDSKFLFWFLRFKRSYLIDQAVGGAQPNISQSILRELMVPVPPIDVQRETVAEIEKQFSRLDEAVVNLQRVKANLKRYKASVLKAAVEGRLVETEASIAQREGRSYETGEQLLQSTLEARQKQWVGRGKYKTPEPPQLSDASLPEGWAWATLEQLHLQIADVDHKMPKAQESGIPYISTKDFFGDESIDFSKAKLISAADYEGLCRKVKPERGDLLLSRYGTVGEVREVSIDEPFQASYSVAILKPVRGFVPIRFLIAALRSDVVQRQIKRDVRATAQPDLGLAHIRQFGVPVPPMVEQLRILEELDRLLSILRGIEAEVENNLLRAQTLRQSTLMKAFT